jgi:very-short-patch-repair endonuclease
MRICIKMQFQKLHEYAKDLRANKTEAEKILWQLLKNRKVAGLKVRRQHPLGNYIADFYCHEKNW